MRLKIVVFCMCLQSIGFVKAQDTFSILAFDSITGEVGAAGASCLDLYQFTGYSNDFICELFPGKGAVATQAAYLAANQIIARNRFNAGDSPNDLINYMVVNDAQNNSTARQYGVVRFDTVYPRSAGFSGINCMNYKNHILGPNYSIHGNILLGAQVLDSMEVRFNREKGDLACKLMAALQGAKMVGADTRCAPNGSSSLFAFVKVSLPNDAFGSPSFLLSLKTHANAGIEPIDSLQVLFDAAKTCTVAVPPSSGINQQSFNPQNMLIYPNPASHRLYIKTGNNLLNTHCVIRDLFGNSIFETDFVSQINLNSTNWKRGVVFVELRCGNNRPVTKKVILD